jgi:outer membrane lipoprotein-sorting protein
MTTGDRFALRHALTMLLIAAAAGHYPPASAQAEGKPKLELTELMHDLRQVKMARGRFVERKYLAILNTPLESSGTLVYTAPGRLEKHMLSPRRESLILDGDTLELEDKDARQRRRLVLQEHPAVRAFVESIRSTLAGDLGTLNRFYEVSLEGEASRWRLQLKPIEPSVRELASEIRISGKGTWVDVIEILGAGGDRSVMTVTRDAA